VVQALAELARMPAASDRSVLFLLDEFAALGRLEAAERAFGLMAGYGVQLWAILQDLHQLNAAYGAAAGTFLSKAGLIQVFNVADVETATWVSRMLGVTTEAYQTTSQSSSRAFGKLSTTESRSTNLHLVKRELMIPDEVMRMGADRMLVMRPGHAPLVGRKVRYHADAEFAGRFDA
jgi:type IV secretion system protein VirD4